MKTIKWTLIGLGVLIIAIVVALLLPPVQKYALKQGTVWFNNTTGGNLSIQDVDIRLPYYIHLNGVKLIDPEEKSLASFESLKLSLGWRMIFYKTIRIDRIELAGLDANLYSDSNGRWNYDFIAEAFSGEPAPDDTSTSASDWDISLGVVKLADIRLAYADSPTRDSITTDIGRLHLVMNRFSLTNFVFIAESLEFENSNTFVQLGPSQTPGEPEVQASVSDSAQSELPVLAINALKLSNHRADYRMTDGSMDMQLYLGTLNAFSKEIDLQNNRYRFSEISLQNTSVEINSRSSEPIDTTTTDHFDIFIPFNIAVDEIEFAENDVRYASTDMANNISEMDIEGLNFNATSLRIAPDLYALQLNNLSGSYGSDLTINKLGFAVDIRPTSASIKNLNLSFGQSELNASATATYGSMQALMDKGTFGNIQLDIPNLRLHPNDLRSINRMAGIHDTSMVSIPSEVFLSTSLSGNQTQIDFPLFNAKMGLSHVDIAGKSSGPDFKNHAVELNAIDVQVNLADLATFLPTDLNVTSYPQEYVLRGNASASARESNLKALLTTSVGALDLDLMSGGWNAEQFPLVGNIYAQGLNLSEMTGIDSLFIIFDLNADIVDLMADTLRGHIALDAHEIDYGRYMLNETCIEVDIIGDVYNYFLEVQDSSASAMIEGRANLGDSLSISVDGNILGVDFEYLGLTEKDFRAQMHVKAEYNMVDSLMWGNLLIDRTIVVREDKRIDIDPVTASFALLSDSSGAEIKSSFLNLKASSNLNTDEITTHLQALFKDEPDELLRKDGYLDVYVETVDEELFLDLFPEIKDFDPSSASIQYDAARQYIKASARFPEIKYETIVIDSVNLDIDGNAGMVAGSFRVGRIAYDSLAIEGIKLSFVPADAGNDFSFQIFNGKDSVQYKIGANIRYIASESFPYWSIKPENTFTLDAKEWLVDSLAQITLKDSLYGIEHFDISRKRNLLSIHTPMEDPVLHLKAANFSLTYLSRLFTLEHNLLEGRLNLDMDLNADGTFEGKADINNLKIFGAEFGRFDMMGAANNGDYKLNAQLEGPTADVEAKGSLTSIADDEARIDVDIFLTRFDFMSLSRLFPSIIRESEGFSTGQLKIGNTTKAPEIKGSLFFENIALGLVDNRAKYVLKNERINIEPNRFIFPSFTIRDSASNKMVINGEIRHRNFINQEYDLTVKSDNFTLLDILPGDDPFVYGKLIVGSDIQIGGTDVSPVIRSDVSLKNGSKMVFQMPEEKYDDMSFDGMVEWVSFNEKEREANKIIDLKKGEEQMVQEASSIDLSGTLRIDPQTKLRIIIDPLAGDNLEITGGGNLGLGYDRSGQLSLNGTYRVSGGSYNMTFYNIVKRNFAISDGSAIMWNGDPYNPEMRITAIYKTRIPLASLMGSQAGGAANESLRRPADFELHMTLSGGLDQTDIDFEIKLGEKSKGMLSGAADARVAQINDNETELNRQVFAMLVLNTFVNDAAPTSGGEALANEARNSASQILTNQLNTLTDKFIGGAVDLNFDMLSYQGASGNAETDLSIDVSKTLFNERVVIKVGSTVPIEGNNTAGAGGSNELITNIIVEYKITADGRYNFKVFRKEDLDDILVGRLTRTGVGVMFRREFDSNQDIFKLTEEEIKLKDALKENEEEGKVK